MNERSTRPDAIVIVLIAAVAENGVIGRANGLPWHLRSDLRHFRSLTLGKPVVMGRKTFQSLKKPLGGRTSIVVSRDRSFCAAGAIVAPNLPAALAVARGDALRRGSGAIAVIGGAEIYAQTMPLADRIEVTLVHLRPEGETLFPVIDPKAWREVERVEQEAGPQDDAAFAFLSYRRVGGTVPDAIRADFC